MIDRWCLDSGHVCFIFEPSLCKFVLSSSWGNGQCRVILVFAFDLCTGCSPLTGTFVGLLNKSLNDITWQSGREPTSGKFNWRQLPVKGISYLWRKMFHWQCRACLFHTDPDLNQRSNCWFATSNRWYLVWEPMHGSLIWDLDPCETSRPSVFEAWLQNVSPQFALYAANSWGVGGKSQPHRLP